MRRVELLSQEPGCLGTSLVQCAGKGVCEAGLVATKVREAVLDEEALRPRSRPRLLETA